MDSSITDRAQGGLGERLRQARVLSPDKALRKVGAAAKALGVSALSLQRYEDGERAVPLQVLESAVEVFGLPIDFFLGRNSAPPSDPIRKLEFEYGGKQTSATAVHETSPPSPTSGGRTFATDAEKISYALGVLDMAGTSNRIVIETSNEVSRAISAAAAALLSPVSGPTPTAAAPTAAEKLERHRAARSTPVAPESAPAAAAGRPKARRSAQ